MSALKVPCLNQWPENLLECCAEHLPFTTLQRWQNWANTSLSDEGYENSQAKTLFLDACELLQEQKPFPVSCGPCTFRGGSVVF